MAKQIRILGLTGDAVFGLWGIYSQVTTAAELPEKAGELAKMLADPPVYLPWLIFVGFAVLTAWTFWPSDKPSDEQREPVLSQSGEQNVQFAGPIDGQVHFGDNHYHDSLGMGGIPLPSPRSFKPRRDINLSEAVAYIIFKNWASCEQLVSWLDNLTDEHDDIIVNALREFEQAARDGDISVWGRNAPYDAPFNWHTTQEPIPPEHWTRHWVDTGSLKNKAKTAMRPPWRRDSDRFYDIMVCKAQVHRKWIR